MSKKLIVAAVVAVVAGASLLTACGNVSSVTTTRTAAPTAKVTTTHIYRLRVITTGTLGGFPVDEYVVTNNQAKVPLGVQANGSTLTEVASVPAGYVVSPCQPAPTATGITTVVYIPDFGTMVVTCPTP